MRFDLTDLRLFLAVVEAGSITRGAAEVGLSLAAASERLRDMEASGALTLLERGRRGVSATEAGEALAHHARVILDQMLRMRGDLIGHAKCIRTSVRLAANTAAITELLPERLAPWLAANPRVDIELKERQSVEVARAVAAGFAEIGICSDAVDTTGLELRAFAIDKLVVVVPRGHRLKGSKRIALSEIVDEPFIGIAGSALQDHVDAQAAKLGVRLKMRLRIRTFEGICQLVGAGAGIAIVPQTAARRCGRQMGIVSVPLGDSWAMRRLSLCTRADCDLARPARALLDHLASGAPHRSDRARRSG